MVKVVPTVTAYTPSEYKQQLELATRLSNRISLDFMDGIFTPAKNLNLIQAYWPHDVKADLHLMYRHPGKHLETLISLQPHLVVLHAEASGNLINLMSELQAVGIMTGVAFLQATSPNLYTKLLDQAQHALVFSGKLGSYGGHYNPKLLQKVHQIRSINPNLELSWDGGINSSNAAELAAAGVNILNVGGYLQQAGDPQNAYDTLVKTVGSSDYAPS